MCIVKPLYGVPEAGTHWQRTYHSHHVDKLNMVPSTYDPCLLICIEQNLIGMVAMQTDDTINIGDEAFAEKEVKEISNAKFISKQREELDTRLTFNGSIIIAGNSGHNLNVIQNGQGRRLELVDYNTPNFKNDYIVQRARGAYIASVYQPEATYDLSVAAQHKEPSTEDVKKPNKRLTWQKENVERGINFIPLDLDNAKLFIFVDGSFANNQDFSSQIGFVIVLANEGATSNLPNEFNLRSNIIHWSSTKAQRVTRIVLASELYGMVHGIDNGLAIGTTINLIMKQLGKDNIPLIVSTDSFSLYECIVKLGSTKEKRLMIDIMAIRQSYERRELAEVRWISGCSNPADAMTKSNYNKALQKLLATNELIIKMEGHLQRESAMIARAWEDMKALNTTKSLKN